LLPRFDTSLIFRRENGLLLQIFVAIDVPWRLLRLLIRGLARFFLSGGFGNILRAGGEGTKRKDGGARKDCKAPLKEGPPGWNNSLHPLTHSISVDLTGGTAGLLGKILPLFGLNWQETFRAGTTPFTTIDLAIRFGRKREGEFFTFCHLKREKCTEFPIFIAKYLFEALISTKDKNLPLTILRKVGKITTVPAPPTGELCGNTNRGHG
jgi:hypothetical protein